MQLAVAASIVAAFLAPANAQSADTGDNTRVQTPAEPEGSDAALARRLGYVHGDLERGTREHLNRELGLNLQPIKSAQQLAEEAARRQSEYEIATARALERAKQAGLMTWNDFTAETWFDTRSIAEKRALLATFEREHVPVWDSLYPGARLHFETKVRPVLPAKSEHEIATAEAVDRAKQNGLMTWNEFKAATRFDTRTVAEQRALLTTFEREHIPIWDSLYPGSRMHFETRVRPIFPANSESPSIQTSSSVPAVDRSVQSASTVPTVAAVNKSPVGRDTDVVDVGEFLGGVLGGLVVCALSTLALILAIPRLKTSKARTTTKVLAYLIVVAAAIIFGSRTASANAAWGSALGCVVWGIVLATWVFTRPLYSALPLSIGLELTPPASTATATKIELKERSAESAGGLFGWGFWIMLITAAIIGRYFGLVGAATFFALWWLIGFIRRSRKQPTTAVFQPSPSGANSRSDTEVASLVSADSLWAQALRELDSDNRQLGLWAKAYSVADGDEPKARAQYLRERVAQLVAAANGATNTVPHDETSDDARSR